MPVSRMFTGLLSLVFFLAWAPAQAEKAMEIDGLSIHYSAFTSAFLQPNVAKNYGITRSRFRGVLTISVLKEEEGSQHAFITGKAINLSSQEKALVFKEVKEANSVYYIATFPYTDKEHLRFEVDVTPENENRTHSLSFKQVFYVD